jgi:SAM-dependent methyltransferase
VIRAEDVASAHDAMESEYDSIEDLWYAHLFNQLHGFLLQYLPGTRPASALDVGCGTGFQSLFLARAGFSVRGFDVAVKLVDCARRKVHGWAQGMEPPWPGYRTELVGFAEEQQAIVSQADALRGHAAFVPPVFEVGDATNPRAYHDGPHDVVVCCGSVLSFIDDHQAVVGLLANSTRRGGMVIVEVEQRVNLDLLWPLIDRVLGGRLEYEQGVSESLRNLLAPRGENVRVDYPFRLADGSEVVLPIWLFSVAYLTRLFRHAGLRPVAHLGVHAATNLIPSTILHHGQPGPGLQRLFRVLAGIDRRMAPRWPGWRLGCSAVFALRRA